MWDFFLFFSSYIFIISNFYNFKLCITLDINDNKHIKLRKNIFGAINLERTKYYRVRTNNLLKIKLFSSFY